MAESKNPRKSNFEIHPFDSGDGIEKFYLIETPHTCSPLKISESVKFVLDLMDGTKSYDEIRESLGLHLGMAISEDFFIRFIKHHLITYELVELDSLPEDIVASCSQVQDEKTIRETNRYRHFFPIVRERGCHHIGRLFSFLFSKYLFPILFSLVIITNVYVILFPPQYSFSGDYNLFLMVGIIGSVLFHEIGHIAGSIYNGITPKEAGVGLFLIFPVFYVDLNQSWKLKRMQRAQIDAGGIYFQLLFSTMAIVVCLLLEVELNLWIFIFTILNLVTINLLPVLGWDGYWLIVDLLGIDNLNTRTSGLLQSFFSGEGKNNVSWKYGLSTMQRRLIGVYGIMLATYLIVIFVNISFMSSYVLSHNILFSMLTQIAFTFYQLDILGGVYLLIALIPYIFSFVYLFLVGKSLLLFITKFIRNKISRSVFSKQDIHESLIEGSGNLNC